MVETNKRTDIYMKVNRARWDELVGHHVNNSTYDLAALKAGNSTLSKLDIDLLGDLEGKRVLHLQCHFGMDSISLLYEGAQEVVGVDFSEQAVKQAHLIAEELNVNAKFIQSDVLLLDQILDERESFDVIYTSYGTIVWLPDLQKWAEQILLYLKPGGKFIIIDAHPLSYIFDDESNEPTLRARYPYFTEGEPEKYEVEGSYATSVEVENKIEYLWHHPVSAIINSLAGVNLHIESFDEYPTVSWQMYPFLEESEDGWYNFPKDWSEPIIPLLFSLQASKHL